MTSRRCVPGRVDSAKKHHVYYSDLESTPLFSGVARNPLTLRYGSSFQEPFNILYPLASSQITHSPVPSAQGLYTKGMRLGNYLIELTSIQFIIKIKNPHSRIALQVVRLIVLKCFHFLKIFKIRSSSKIPVFCL